MMAGEEVSSVATLADILSVETVRPGAYRASAHQPNHTGAIFGGSLLAQAVVCAELSAPGRLPHSMHSHFHRPASCAGPVEYVVQSLKDGTTFALRRIEAYQNGAIVFAATASLSSPQEGPRHTLAWSNAPPMPEMLEPLEAYPIDRATAVTERDVIERFAGAIEIRPLDPAALIGGPAEPRTRFWTRAVTEAAAEVSPFAAVAFLSDYLMSAACTLPHFDSPFDPDVVTASLDHAIWFAEPYSVQDWLLFETESFWAGFSRGLNSGRLYTRAGALVAMVAQEQFVRRRGQ